MEHKAIKPKKIDYDLLFQDENQKNNKKRMYMGVEQTQAAAQDVPINLITLEELEAKRTLQENEKLRVQRFQQRKSLDGLISSILTLDMFRRKDRKLECMPDAF